MVNQELLTYIKAQLANNVRLDLIKQSLLQNNWKIADVNQAISMINQPQEIKNNLDMSTISRPGFFDKRIGRKKWALIAIITNLLSPSLFKPEFAQLPLWIRILLIVLTLMLIGIWLIHSIWRINDIGRPKWYILLALIPIVNIFIGLDLLFTKGKIHSLLTETNVLGLPKCPSCGRTFSNNKNICPYCNTPLEC